MMASAAGRSAAATEMEESMDKLTTTVAGDLRPVTMDNMSARKEITIARRRVNNA
jgi:hypothetical protein